MLLRYDGNQYKFSRHGKTWKPGDIIDVDITPQDAAWLLRHGFTEVIPAKPVPMVETSTDTQTSSTVNVVMTSTVLDPLEAEQSIVRSMHRRGRK